MAPDERIWSPARRTRDPFGGPARAVLAARAQRQAALLRGLVAEDELLRSVVLHGLHGDPAPPPIHATAPHPYMLREHIAESTEACSAMLHCVTELFRLVTFQNLCRVVMNHVLSI